MAVRYRAIRMPRSQSGDDSSLAQDDVFQVVILTGPEAFRATGRTAPVLKLGHIFLSECELQEILGAMTEMRRGE